MALDHVTHRPTTAVIITGTAFNTVGFRMGDLHMINVMPIPQRFENQIIKAQYQQILHCFLANVMINAVNLVFAQMLFQTLLQQLGGGQIVSKGFFNHHASPTIMFTKQLFRCQTFGDGSIKFWTNGQIENDVFMANIPRQPLP